MTVATAAGVPEPCAALVPGTGPGVSV